MTKWLPNPCSYSLLLIITASAVHGSAISNVLQLNVLDSLFCTVNGNVVAELINKPLAGVDVRFTCNGGKTTLAQLVTNATGLVDSVVKLADGIAFDPSVCYLEVGLPIGGCTVLPPNGVLRAPVTVVSIVQTTLSAVVRVVGGPFAHA